MAALKRHREAEEVYKVAKLANERKATDGGHEARHLVARGELEDGGAITSKPLDRVG